MSNENFISDFVKFNLGTEVPDIYALWCGIGAVSAALGRRVTIDMGHYRIFPNFYIVLVGGSGIKKSTAVRQAARFIREIQPTPNLISQKITPEALIKALHVDMVEGVIPHEPSCIGFVLCDELANFLNQGVYEAGLGALLTPLYDCDDVYEYTTLGRGKEKLTNLCLGILGGATVDWIQKAIPESAVGGGVTSRFIFVYVEERPKPQAITTFSEEKRVLAEVLTRAIQRISTYTGEVKLTTDSWGLYSKEYDKYYYESPLFLDKNLSGYANRRMQHLLKIALILSVSESPELVIRSNHFLAAKAILEQAEISMPTVLGLITSSTQGATVSKIYTTIKRCGEKGIPKYLLLSAFVHQITNREFIEIISTLTDSHKIKSVAHGNEIRYYCI